MNQGCSKGNKIIGNPDMPDDILVDILIRLPTKSLLRFKCVCKSWCSLIQDQTFIDTHCDHRGHEANKKNTNFRLMELCSSGFQFHSVDQRAGISTQIGPSNRLYSSIGFSHPYTPSCNGLFCFLAWTNDLIVCNPMTNENVTLPRPTFLEGMQSSEKRLVRIGFGFDVISKKYKVVGCTLRHYLHSPPKVEVLTLGDRSWKIVNGGIMNPSRVLDKVVCLNGVLYWLSTPGGRVIRSFDLGDEKFGVLSTPPSIRFSKTRHWLGDLEGCLCLIDHDNNIVDLWVLTICSDKQEWDNQRIFLPIDSRPRFYPFPVRKGEIMMQSTKATICDIYHYDQQGQVGKTIKVTGLHPFMFLVGIYDDTLVTLKNLYVMQN
ncbi:F-box domain containing protein [Thalictrum thalictroides]|uniref:F-box domain containing protein n=1 Tax=Thalictrum thalictroides TaxID=46969 RepID=A0A7J6X900_THATH|nr:F-box domain containing protein [Thalictrum thalictroides]